MSIRELKVFISSPMDVPGERAAAVEVVYRLNQEPEIARRFALRVIRYEDTTPPLVGEPQETVNLYIGEAANADVVVCIFGRRMGSETMIGRVLYKSGTYYEFVSAYRAQQRRRPPWPQILLYRALKPAPPTESSEEKRKYQAVEEFFRKFHGKGASYKGLIKESSSPDDFRDKLLGDLRRVLHQTFPQPKSFAERMREKWALFETPEASEHRHRITLLKKVDDFWVRENLDAFTTGLRQPVRVSAQVLGKVGSSDNKTELPVTSVAEFFEARFVGTRPNVLILGAKGSGKSFQMIELVDLLLDQARADHDRAIPVILQLSSWARQKFTSRQEVTFEGWIVSELVAVYQLPRKVAERWVHNNRLDLCLDGLDEITVMGQDDGDETDKLEAEQAQQRLRTECLRQVNEFVRLRNWGVGIVLCCREEEYRALDVQFELPPKGGFTLRLLPLTRQQIEDHLEVDKDELSSLREALQKDALLLEMAGNLFLFNAMMLAYSNAKCPSAEDILMEDGDKESRRRDLFTRYVSAKHQSPQNQNRRKGRHLDRPYTVREIDGYLAKLARYMQSGSQATLLLVERLQPDWLPPKTHWQFVGLSALMVFVFISLTTGAPVALALGIESGMEHYLNSGSLASLAACFDVGLQQCLRAFGIIALTGGGISAFGFATSRGWGFGVFLGISLAISRGFAIGISAFDGGLQRGIRVGLVTGALSVPILGLLYWLREEKNRGDLRDVIRPLEIRSWDWRRGLIGAASGAAVGLVFWYMFGDATGLGFGLSVPLFLALIYGQFGTRISLKTEPNQGIRQSLANALRYGIVLAVIGFVPFGVGYGFPTMQHYDAPPYAPGLGKYLGLEQGLVNGTLGLVLTVGMIGLGLMPFFKHVALRYLLVRHGRIPKLYVRFLEAAADLGLLRRVGGGYAFEHEYLRSYYREYPLDDAYLRSLK